MTGYHMYAFSPAIDLTGVVGLAFVASPDSFTTYGAVNIAGYSETFRVVDITEPGEDTTNSGYKGGIQSVDKGFTASPILIPIPQEFPVGYELGFVESGVITIAGVWFDGLRAKTVTTTGPPPITTITYPRDIILEDLRTSKNFVHPNYTQSPYILLLSDRAYPVFITGYSANIVGGQGDIISFRLGLAICQIEGHYTAIT